MLRAVVIVFLGLTALTLACQAAPLPLGSVSNITSLASCPAGFPTGAQCSQATVSCPNTANIQVTFGIHQVPDAPRGTIVFFGGGGGTAPYGADFDRLYTQAGYSLATLAWGSEWEDTGLAQKNIRTAACRPATMLNFILRSAAPGAKCAQGISGGSAAVAYSLSAYGAAAFLDKVELLSGPVFSDISRGCKVPNPAPVTVCPPGQFGCEGGDTFQDSSSYLPTSAAFVGHLSNDPSCGGSMPTTSRSQARWKSMSIVDGTAQSSFFYPNTSLSGWVCDNGLNNSAAQGDLFYRQFTSIGQTASFHLTPIKNCAGAEGVDNGQTSSGQTGLLAIVADMTDPIQGCVEHAH